MVTTIPNIAPNSGNGWPQTSGPTYCPEELDVLKAQAGVITGLQINVVYDAQGTVGIVGLDGFGQPMLQSNDLIVLPCPPYCNTDYDSLKLLDTSHAINYIAGN